MTVSLCRDAARVNQVVNHPSVRPFAGAPELGGLDFTSPVGRPENWFLMGDHGGFALIWTAPHTHEVHAFILPEGRGHWARQAGASAITFAREHGDTRLWARVLAGMRHVAIYARGMGMRPTGEVIETLGKQAEILEMELV